MYKTVAGDTFESISLKKYGVATYATQIKAANPGAKEPFNAGIELVAPQDPEAPQDVNQDTVSGVNEVTILINDKRFHYWTSVDLSRAIDTVDTVSFSAPFDADSADFRQTFKPFSYQKISIAVSGKLFFTGTLIDVSPDIDNNSKTIDVQCYSKPGVLGDVTPPVSGFPLEFKNQSLSNIAKKLLQPFGIGVESQSKNEEIFKKVACKPEQKILPFLINLAKQKGLLISSTLDGKLLITDSITSGAPVAKLKQGESPLLDANVDFDPQEYYSHVTAIRPKVKTPVILI